MNAQEILATLKKLGKPQTAAIGVFKPAVRKKAIETAKRIGTVEVDHGETNCKTPDAVLYIEKASKR